jgi:hypothetical protein
VAEEADQKDAVERLLMPVGLLKGENKEEVGELGGDREEKVAGGVE